MSHGVQTSVIRDVLPSHFADKEIGSGMKEGNSVAACREAIHQGPRGRGPGSDVRVPPRSLAPAGCGACQGTSLRLPCWPHFAHL